MNDLIIKNITITGIQSTDKKFTLIAEDGKYNFWVKKVSGEETTAYQQFQKFGFRTGDQVEIAVREEEKDFKNDKGKLISFTDRTIMYFSTDKSGTPKATTLLDAQNSPVSTTSSKEIHLTTPVDLGEINAKLDEIRDTIKRIENRPF